MAGQPWSGRRGTLRVALSRLTPAVVVLLVATAVAHLALMILRAIDADIYGTVILYLAWVPGLVLEVGPQGLVAMVLVHDPKSVFHIFFNLLLLWSLGPMVERALGTRRFVGLYLASTLGGSLVHTLYAVATGSLEAPAYGSSGAVLGVLVAFGLLHPEAQVRVWLAAPMRAASLVWLVLGLDLVFALGSADVAIPVHVGGMLGGWAYLRKPWRPANARALWRQVERRLARRRW